MKNRTKLIIAAGTISILLLFTKNTFGIKTINGEIVQFNLKTCGELNCYSLRAPKAFVGFYDSSYSFDSAEIKKTHIKSGKTEVLSVNDAYYDSNSNMLFIHKIPSKNNIEAIYNLNNGTIHFYY